MPQRRTVVLATAATIFAFVALLGLGLAMSTRTAWGRERIRAYVASTLNRSVKGGRWYVGKINGSLFTDLRVDSFSLREPNDSLFIATGPVTVKFDPRDLWDRRIVVREVIIERPVVAIRQDSLGAWNYRKIFPPGPPGPKRTAPGFGDYIVVNNATIHNGAFHLTMPWRPADSLRGAKRDSAVAFALGRKDKAIRRVGSNYVQTRSWTRGELTLTSGRIANRDTAGRFFTIQQLAADGFDPPIAFSHARGTVRTLGDSLWADFAHFDLPRSTGSAKGKVWWGGGRPTRYDLAIRGDSVSLSDVAWVYPTLPTTGGGSMTLNIRNEEDLRVLDYALTEMDVRSMGSRLRGGMTFGVGGPVLVVKNVDMEATPIDWVLIERLTGEPLPYPWKGTIEATIKASGGPVNQFRIDEGQFAFADANVRGATARGSVRGTIDMVFPAFTKFRGLDVRLDHLDLATLQFLNPTFPRLDGSISGVATLDSVWTDVRFRNADMTHRFADMPVSRATGAGRVTIGEKFLTYDVALDADSLNLTTIARAWPELVLEQRGALVGPVRLQGTAEDLDVSTTMSGASGTYGFDGRVDIDSIGGYKYRGTLRFSNANLRTLYDTAAMPMTSLNGAAQLDIKGDSVLNYVGSVVLDFDRSVVDSTRLYQGGHAKLGFADGVLRVDSLRVESSLGAVTAKGGLGLRPEKPDSLVLRFASDSLGGLRPYLLRRATDSTQRAAVEADSLVGELSGTVTLTGSIDTLGAHGVLEGRGVSALAAVTDRFRLSADLQDLTSEALRGQLSLTSDSVSVATIAFRNAAVDMSVRRRDSSDVRVMTQLANGPAVDATGSLTFLGDSTHVRMSQARLAFEDHEWSLQKAGGARWWSTGFAVDSLVLGGSAGGTVRAHGIATAEEPVALQLAVDSVALSDIASVAQMRVKLAGTLSLHANITGTRAAPLMEISGRLLGTKVGQVNLSESSLRGRYADRRLTGSLGIVRGDSTVLSLAANLPLDLALMSRGTRLLEDTLRLSAVSRDVDLKLIESFTPAVTEAVGRLNANISLAGTPRARELQGFVRVDSGGASVTDLGVRFRELFADLEAERDTVKVRRLSLVSGGPRDVLNLGGYVALDEPNDPSFDLNLTARNFHAINRRRVGDLRVSAGLRFRGRESASVLTGNVTVDEGYLVIPELTSKEVITVDDTAFAASVDTSLGGTRRVLPRLPKLLQGLRVENVGIAMGTDVRLSSSEANIKLGGSVNVIRATALSASGVPQLAVEGALRTERGTFLMRFGDVLLQRLFTIEGGEVRFFGDADFNPTLNVSALYAVRQNDQAYSNRNIRIRLRLLGTLAQPRIGLQSADSLELSDSDMIAYLLTGRPSADIGGLDRFYYRDLLLTSLGSSLSQRYSGRFFDYIQLQSVAGGVGTLGSNANSKSLFAGLAGTQLGLGKQLNDRLFISLTTGFCPLQQFFGGGTTTPLRAADNIGGRLEYTIRSGLGVSVSREPPLAATLCSLEAVGFAAVRRPQLSLDLFRTWRW